MWCVSVTRTVLLRQGVNGPGGPGLGTTFIGYPVAPPVEVLDDPVAALLGGEPCVAPQPTDDRVTPAVLGLLADLLGAARPVAGRLTVGRYASNHAALAWASRRLAGPAVLVSRTAHPSVARAADRLGMPVHLIAVQDDGEMDYAGLAGAVRGLRGWPLVVVAAIGTPWSEARDDLVRIRAAVAEHDDGCLVHADAGSVGLAAAVLRQGAAGRLLAGADMVAVCGHSLLGGMLPFAAVLSTRSDLTGDQNPAVSDSPAAARMWWSGLTRHGVVVLRQRAAHCRDLAGYAERALKAIGWPCWRLPDAATVVLKRPPAPIRARWRLCVDGPWSHLVCTPGARRSRVDAFVSDLYRQSPPAPRPLPVIWDGPRSGPEAG
jgi:histidine decarboxylase